MSEAENSAGQEPLWARVRRHAMRAAALTVVVLLGIYVLSGVRIIKPNEQAVVLRCGKRLAAPLLPGTHYTFPYPIDRVHVFRPNEVKSVVVGGGKRLQQAARQSGAGMSGGAGPEFLTGDENIIHLELNVQYQIGDPGAFLFRAVSAEDLIVIACESALATEVARTHVDDILTSGRHVLLAQVKKTAQETLARMNAGVSLISVNLAKATPPMQVADAFKDVASALEDQDRLINEANGEYNEAIPRTRGKANEIVQQALADRNGSIQRAQGEAARFLQTLTELRHAKNTELAVLRFYLEEMEKLMPGLRKYIIDTEGIGGRRREPAD